MNYNYISTFWEDFTLIEHLGTQNTIAEFAKKLFDEWKDNYELLTELVMILNHKCWYWHDKGNHELSSFYGSLYYKYDTMAIDYLKANRPEKELTYYFNILD